MNRPPTAAPSPATAAPSPWAVLLVSLLGISCAAPLVRLSEAPAIVVAAWRLGFSLVVIAGILTVRREWGALRGVARRDWWLMVSAGVLLAGHFWSWNVSLRYTTVAASVSLVNLQPVVIAFVSGRWLGERASGRQWLGIGVAVLGALLVGVADAPGGISGLGAALMGGSVGEAGRMRALLGDLLACVGAITGALYYLIGRRVRPQLSLWPYVAVVYGAAWVTCMFVAVGTGQPLGPQPPRELALFAGLALGPMLLGHTGMNWALGHLPAYVVNLTTLGEPIGATALAALLPGIAEVPGPATIAGGALVLGGVILAARRG